MNAALEKLCFFREMFAVHLIYSVNNLDVAKIVGAIFSLDLLADLFIFFNTNCSIKNANIKYLLFFLL